MFRHGRRIGQDSGLRGRSLGCGHRLQKSVAPLGQCFDVVRISRLVPKRFSQLTDGNPQAAVVIDKSIPLPDAAFDFCPRHHFAWVLEQKEEQTERLILDLDPLTVFQELACSGIDCEGAKSVDSPWSSLHSSTPGGE